MAENSAIAWTTHTFNPWIGCTKVAEGCKFCYAEQLMDTRYGKVEWGQSGTRVLTSPANWKLPLKWNREAAKAGVRARVFCASLADVFEDWQGEIRDHKGNMLWGQGDLAPAESPITMIDVRRRLFALIDATPHLDWLLLTKRPENINRFCPIPFNGREGSDPLVLQRDNCWLGTSIATHADADKNIPELLKCRDLSPVLFVSAEPLIEEITLMDLQRLKQPKLDWVIIGGESGAHARPCDVAWIRSLKDQCAAAGVPCFVKQLGAKPTIKPSEVNEWIAGTMSVGCDHPPRPLLNDSKGGDWNEWPTDLRVREFPKVTI